MKVYFKQDNRHNWKKIIHNVAVVLAGLKKDVEIEIKEIGKKPTQNQRAYYYGVILPLIRKVAADQGAHYSNVEELDNDIKGIMKDKYSLYLEIENKITNEVECRPISLSEVKGDKELTSKYIQTVIDWAGMFFNIEIPLLHKNDKY